MNVSLTPNLEEYVRLKVDSGMYSTSSEVIRAGLRMLIERDLSEQINQGIEAGLQDVEAGRVIPSEQCFDENRQMFKGTEERQDAITQLRTMIDEADSSEMEALDMDSIRKEAKTKQGL